MMCFVISLRKKEVRGNLIILKKKERKFEVMGVDF